MKPLLSCFHAPLFFGYEEAVGIGGINNIGNVTEGHEWKAVKNNQEVGEGRCRCCATLRGA